MAGVRYWNEDTEKWELISTGAVTSDDGTIKYSAEDIDEINTEIETTSFNLNTHKIDLMPHYFIDEETTFKWGFRTYLGNPQIIYEEVED